MVGSSSQSIRELNGRPLVSMHLRKQGYKNRRPSIEPISELTISGLRGLALTKPLVLPSANFENVMLVVLGDPILSM